MCGILAIAAPDGHAPSVSDAQAARMRDLMAHRGPDDATLERHASVLLAHRRLAVLDPTPAGRQPMTTPDGRFSLIYNGELYNDAELRAELEAEGVRFRSSCDTETVLHALARWGPDAAPRLRGMYAFALHDRRDRTLLLGRDPMGIKPLYLWRGEVDGHAEMVAASEIPAILAHPRVSARPDLVGISAYLTTIRPVVGSRTMFEGVRAVRPGEWIGIDLASETLRETTHEAPIAGATGEGIREMVEDSVRRHLRSDVPTCCLLSGGLDSSVVCAVARRETDTLRTYCAGAADAGSDSADFEFAREVAAALDSEHTEAIVTPELFVERWREMVERQGVVLSTPNEVAINEVARAIRGRGDVVTLSGEGADELFGGYELPMALAAEHASGSARLPRDGGEFHLASAAWIPAGAKNGVMSPPAARAVEGDAWLFEAFNAEFDACEAEVGAGARGDSDQDIRVQAHLRFHRRVNLSNLLRRLDSATMLESVEGRTPFADAAVCAAAEALPMARKYQAGGGGADGGTKIALREAFAGELLAAVVARPKASFPLPFQGWVGDCAGALRESVLAGEIFDQKAVADICARPGELWHMAWPMINVALWGRRWWG